MGNIMNQCAMDEPYSICTSSNKENTTTSSETNNKDNNVNSNAGSDHMLDDPLVGSILSANCTGNVCDPNTLLRITMAATSQSRFLVEHAVDKSERRLLSPLKVNQVMIHLQELPLSLSNSQSAVTAVTSSSCNGATVTHTHANVSAVTAESSQSQTSAQLQPNENGILGRYNKQHDDDTTTVQQMRKNNAALQGNGQILVLRMRVHFADFYRSTYLDAFPRHIEKGSAQARTIDAAPEVAPVNSHDSLMQALSIDSEMDNKGDGNAPRNVRLALSPNKEMFLNLCLQGSLGLKDQDAALMGGKHHQVSVVSHVARTSNHNAKQLVLLDRRTRSPVAVCTLKSKYGPPVITIHSPNPNVFCQAPSPGIKFEGRALYPYAEFHVEGEWPLPVRYSISFAVGNNRYEDQPSYRASHVKVGSPDISVVGKTGSESVMTGCCLINLSKSSDRFTLSIAKGVDPAIFICLAAIVDEVLEHTMRRQFANQKRDEINVRR